MYFFPKNKHNQGNGDAYIDCQKQWVLFVSLVKRHVSFSGI